MDRKNLKILLTTRHSRLQSGSTHQLYLLAQELKERGHRVYVLFKGERGKPLHPSLRPLSKLELKVDLARFTKLKYRHTIPELIWLRKFLLAEQFDLVNTFSGTDLSNLILAGSGIFIPALISYRGLAEPLDFFNSIKYRLPKVRKVIANSQAVKEIMIKTGHLAPEKIEVIYGGFDLKKFRPGIDRGLIRKEFGISDSAPVVIIIAHLKFWPEHRKGGYYFLQAGEKVLAQRPDTRFLLVGKADQEEFQQAASPALRQATIFTGYRSDIPELIAGSDLLVSASLSEGMAGVIRESMAMERPVVATEIDGTPELVKPNRTGILVPPKDPEALAKGILQLLVHPDQGRAMGIQGRKLVEDLCDNRKRVDQYERIYFEEYAKATRVRHTFWHRRYWEKNINDE